VNEDLRQGAAAAMKPLPTASLLLILAVPLAGCQAALKDERQVEVKAGDLKSVLYEVQKRAKKVRVEVRSSGVPVDAYLVLEKDREALLQELDKSGKPSGVLAQQLKTESATLQATIPAQQAFALVLTSRGGKDATVTVKASEGP